MKALREAAIEVAVPEARAKVAEYVRSVRDRHDAEDAAILRGYRWLARGKTVIDLSRVIGLGGVHENGLPRLAVATASHAWVWVERGMNGGVTFMPVGRWDLNPRRRKDVYRFPAGTLEHAERPPQVNWESPWGGRFRAMVPHIPPGLRPARSLDGYAVLFEADDWAMDPTAPRDPALLKHLGGHLYAVLATWDLTELERTVLNGRNA